MLKIRNKNTVNAFVLLKVKSTRLKNILRSELVLTGRVGEDVYKFQSGAALRRRSEDTYSIYGRDLNGKQVAAALVEFNHLVSVYNSKRLSVGKDPFEF